MVITVYFQAKERFGKLHLLTDSQKKYYQAKWLIIQAEPKFFLKKPKNSALKLYIWNFINYPYDSGKESWFNKLITGCILANTIVLILQWDGQSEQISNILDWVNNIFVVIFTIEIILKRLIYG